MPGFPPWGCWDAWTPYLRVTKGAWTLGSPPPGPPGSYLREVEGFRCLGSFPRAACVPSLSRVERSLDTQVLCLTLLGAGNGV